MTVEEDVYALLGIEFKTDYNSDKVTVTQGGLTKKVLNTAGMLDINNKTTPGATIPLGTNTKVTPFDKPWECAFVVLMLMYISRNSRPDTHLSLH